MSLDKKNISQYLIWDYVNYKNQTGYNKTEEYIKANFSKASLVYKKYGIILKFIDRTYNMMLSLISFGLSKKKEKILFFMGSKYSSLILGAKQKYDVEMIVGGKKDRIFAMRHLIKYDSYSDLNHLIFNYLSKKDESYLNILVNYVLKRIEKSKPKYIVLWNDCLPMVRAIIMSAKSFGVATLVFQHGIFDEFSLESGKVADYVLVWGNYFRDIAINKNLRKIEDTFILGYPFFINKKESEKNRDKRKKCYNVYYLGQNFEEQNEKFIDIKIKTVKNIGEICKKLGMKFVYRSHPGDNVSALKGKLPGICFTHKKEKINDSISQGDIFISFNSTALIEAKMRSKISLQLMNYPIELDNLEHLGVCDKSFKIESELEDYLGKISKAQSLDEFKKNFNNEYIETRYNLGNRFAQILEEIKNKKYE